MTRVVGVHGARNHKAGKPAAAVAQALSDSWTTALRTGFGPQAPAFDLRVSYYSPHLQTTTAQGPDTDPDTLDPDTQQMIRAWVHQLGAPVAVAQGPGMLPIRPTLDWVADTFGLDHTLARAFVTVFFREVATYLSGATPDARQNARAAVAETIGSHTPRIVLAHSLGSVVAYEALWANPHLHVDLLVTLGSPLGMPDVVFQRLDPRARDGRGQRPPNVATWINVADPDDLIAIPRRLGTRFAGIDAELETSIHAFDFHQVGRYLASPTLAAAVLAHLDTSSGPG